MNSADSDNYSLDDTPIGRLVQAGLAAAFVAVPDQVTSRTGRFLARTALLGAGIGAVAVANAAEEDPADEPEDFALDAEAGSPLLTWAVIGGLGAAVAGLAAGEGAVAKRLNRRGVRLPHTVLGALTGVAVWGASELTHRRHEAGDR